MTGFIALWEQVRWGDVASWIEAIGNILTFALATTAAIVAWRTFRQELSRDERTAQREERAQARLVNAWLAIPEGLDNESLPGNVIVRNSSEAPVYQASLTVQNLHDPDSSQRFDISVIPPGDTHWAAMELASSEVTEAKPPAPADYRVQLAFTDAAGIRWMRDRESLSVLGEDEFLIWADSSRVKALKPFIDKLLSRYNIRVRYHSRRIEDLLRDFVFAVKTGAAEVPDVLVGPHDWIGDLVEFDAIDEVALSERHRERFSDITISAMTYHGKLYGVPYASDTIALLRNTRLTDKSPRTVEEMIIDGQQLRYLGKVKEVLALQVGGVGDLYHIYPMFTSLCGWVFAHTGDGEWDLSRVGLDSHESIIAFERLRELGEQGSNVLRREIDHQKVTRLFMNEKTAFMYSSGSAVSRARAKEIPFTAERPPPFVDMAQPRNFVTVQAFYLPHHGKNRNIANELVADYLMTTEVAMALYEVQPRPPALREALHMLTPDDPMWVYQDLCREGELMPSFPGAAEVWKLVGEAQARIIGGANARSEAQKLAQSVRAVVSRRVLRTGN